jgi:hypothetical protein
MNILEISKNVATNLDIDSKEFENIIRSRLTEDQLNEKIIDRDKVDKINQLLRVDLQFLDFEKKNIKSENTKKNFNKLKENLGKLQILVLIKNLEKSKDCDSVLNVLLSALNNKFETVNTILSDDLVQSGGGSVNHFDKYIKYKVKYLNLTKQL